MTPAKFKIGDVVNYVFGSKSRITAVCYRNKSWRYKLEMMDNPSSFYKDEWIAENQLSFFYDLPKSSANYVPKGPMCPECNSKWVTSSFGTKKWYDCPTCKKPAEELENQRHTYHKYNSWWSD